jgi:N6-adenosine-specific RNA methylase IME4
VTGPEIRAGSPAGGYRCIVADPPWPVKGAGRPMTVSGEGEWHERVTGTASRPLPYQTMPVEQIAALPVAGLADPVGCHLYLWTTNGFLDAAFDVIRAWGFRYSTTIVWAKTPMGGGLGGAFGISTEYLLFARRGSLPALSRVRGTWHQWKRPYNAAGKPMHSGKPPEAFELIEQVSPGPRLEMFARRVRPGWDAWGDQAPGAVALPALDSGIAS